MKVAYYIGMDIAKLNFQVYGASKSGKKLYNKRLHRSAVLDFFAKMDRQHISGQFFIETFV